MAYGVFSRLTCSVAASCSSLLSSPAPPATRRRSTASSSSSCTFSLLYSSNRLLSRSHACKRTSASQAPLSAVARLRCAQRRLVKATVKVSLEVMLMGSAARAETSYTTLLT